MYVPKKIQPNFELSKEKHGANIITKGALFCCGQYEFSIRYYGELRKNHIYSGEDNFLALIAICTVCGREIRVFNSVTDGYDGCINCENGCDTHQPHELMSFLCPKCLKNSFSIKITFEYQSKECLEEIGIKKYDNAFSWIWISLTCSSCRRKMKNFINMETS